MLLFKDWLLPGILKADRKGVTALEYALLGALIAVAIVSAVTGFGMKLSTAFSYIQGALP